MLLAKNMCSFTTICIKKIACVISYVCLLCICMCQLTMQGKIQFFILKLTNCDDMKRTKRS